VPQTGRAKLPCRRPHEGRAVSMLSREVCMSAIRRSRPSPSTLNVMFTLATFVFTTAATAQQSPQLSPRPDALADSQQVSPPQPVTLSRRKFRIQIAPPRNRQRQSPPDARLRRQLSARPIAVPVTRPVFPELPAPIFPERRLSEIRPEPQAPTFRARQTRRRSRIFARNSIRRGAARLSMSC